MSSFFGVLIKMQSVKNKLFNGALLLTISTVAVKMIGLFFKLPLSYVLGDEGMNYFNTAYSVYTFFYIISTAGIPKAVSTITAAEESQGRAETARYIASIALRTFFIFGLILGIAFAVFSPIISTMLGTKKSLVAMIAISPAVSFVAGSGVLRGFFTGKLNFLPIAISEAISAFAKLVLGLFLAFIGVQLSLDVHIISALAISGVSFGSLFGYLYLYFYNIKKNGNLKSETPKINAFECTSRILKISTPITATSAVSSFINIIDIAVVMHALIWSGFSELQANIIYGNYTTLVVPMFNLVGAILAPISAVMLPAMVGKGNESFDEILSGGLHAACYISVPLSILLGLFSSSILSFIFEDSAAIMAAPLLFLIAPSFVLMSITTVLNTALEAKGKFWTPLISLSIGSFTKLIISGVMIRNEALCMLAAPLGTVIYYLVSLSVSIIALKTAKNKSLNLSRYLISSLIISFVAAIPAKIFEYRVQIKNFYIKSVLSYIIFGIIYCVLYTILIFRSKLSNNNRHLLQNL